MRERIVSPPRERAQQAARQARSDEEQVVSPVLLLQRQAGNRAVGSLLAREAGKSEAETPATATIIFPEPIGVLIIDAFRLESRGEISVILPGSSKDPKLFQAANDGKDLGDVVISSAIGINFKIADAIISQIHVSRLLSRAITQLQQRAVDEEGRSAHLD